MNFIKKSILVILLLSISISAFAQKESVAEKRATIATDYIAEKMNLDADKKSFVHEVLVEKFQSNMAQTKGKNLTSDEKKVIFKGSNGIAMKKLGEKFTKEEVKQINKYQLEAHKIKAKKK